MGALFLPNEILLEIARNAARKRYCNPEERQPWLWNLARVNKVFREAARSKLFRRVELVVEDIGQLRRQAEILCGEGIGINVEFITLRCMKTKTFDAAVGGGKKKETVSASKDDPGYDIDIYYAWLDAIFFQYIDPPLRKVLAACIRLRQLHLRLETPSARMWNTAKWLSPMVLSCLTDHNYERLRRLEIATDRLDVVSCFWMNTPQPSVLDYYTSNISRISELMVDVEYSLNGNKEASAEMLGGLEQWAGSLSQLEKLDLRGMDFDESEEEEKGPNDPSTRGLHVVPFCGLNVLHTLALDEVDLHDSLSEFIDAMSKYNSLRTLELIHVTIASDNDRWDDVFENLLRIDLIKFRAGGLQYNDLPERCELKSFTLCSSVEDDHAAFNFFANDFLAKDTNHPFIFVSDCFIPCYGDH